MDKTLKLELIRRIAEWEETENPYAALPIAADLLQTVRDAIENDAELEGWYSELELAEQGVIEGKPSTPQVQLDDFVTGKWRVHLVLPGERYGATGSIVYSDDDAQKGGNLPLVEFYDTSQDPSRFPGGQFVTRYYMSTLFDEHWGDSITAMADKGSSLSLDGGIPSWTVQGRDLKAIASFLSTAKSCIERRKAPSAGSDLASESQEACRTSADLSGLGMNRLHSHDR